MTGKLFYWHVCQVRNRFNAWQGFAATPEDAYQRAALRGNLGKLSMNDVAIARVHAPRGAMP